MAVIKCSLKDGSLKVEEVLQFERGDQIQLAERVDPKVTQFNPRQVCIIPCPPAQDCVFDTGVVLAPFPPGDVVATNPKQRQ